MNLKKFESVLTIAIIAMISVIGFASCSQTTNVESIDTTTIDSIVDQPVDSLYVDSTAA